MSSSSTSALLASLAAEEETNAVDWRTLPKWTLETHSLLLHRPLHPLCLLRVYQRNNSSSLLDNDEVDELFQVPGL